MSSTIKLLSLVGPGRSGSTLLARIVGGSVGSLDLGELRWLWQRGLQEQRPCGCGEPPSRCPFWSPVLSKTLGSPLGTTAAPDDRRVAEIVALQRRLSDRRRRVGLLRSARSGAAVTDDLVELRDVTGALVDALGSATGAELLVDSSKRPIDAAVVAGLPNVEHYVLHLVRDPRAVAFSWGRAKPLPTATPRADRMATRPAWHSAGRWMESNLGCELLRRQIPADRWRFLRYEDFVAQPRETARRLFAWLGRPEADVFRASDRVSLPVNHTLAGNPSRFDTGDIVISSDDEWQRAMSRRQRALVTSLTLPLLLRYGYPAWATGSAVQRSKPRTTA